MNAFIHFVMEDISFMKMLQNCFLLPFLVEGVFGELMFAGTHKLQVKA